MFSAPLHISGSEFDDAHGLETCGNTIIKAAKHNSADLESLGKTVQRLLILAHLTVDISKSELSIGHPFVVQTKFTLPGSETIVVAINSGDVFLPIFVNVSNILQSIGSLESISILLPNLQCLIQQLQGHLVLAFLAFDEAHNIQTITNELMIVAEPLSTNLQSIVKTIESFFLFSVIMQRKSHRIKRLGDILVVIAEATLANLQAFRKVVDGLVVFGNIVHEISHLMENVCHTGVVITVQTSKNTKGLLICHLSLLELTNLFREIANELQS
mmetsp:Transcript_15105/g.43664  ORF Transcript_15105/g.43664 Transcript_15105/m.43664 type:complete len:272 (-) Transcript_15105:577-1392(-)